MATERPVPPLVTPGSRRRRCSALPASSTVSAPRTPELKNGPGTGARPSSSWRTAASVRLLSLPPYSAGTRMPSQPASQALRHRSGTRLDSARWSATTACRGASRSTNVRAAERSISWDSVRDRSTRGPSGLLLLLLVLLQALEREAAVAPRGAGGHGHGHEGGLGDLRVRGPRARRLLGVGLDAPGALRDLRDAQGRPLLGPAGKGTVLERLWAERREGAIGLGSQLAHARELRPHVDSVKLHDGLLVVRPCALSARGRRAFASRARPGGPPPCPRSARARRTGRGRPAR